MNEYGSLFLPFDFVIGYIFIKANGITLRYFKSTFILSVKTIKKENKQRFRTEIREERVRCVV